MHIVTGGAGFIGSVMLWKLNGMGVEDIVVVDNLGTGEKWRNLVGRRYAEYMHRDEFHDLLKRNALPWKPEAVIHLGACSATTERDADFLMRNNVRFSTDIIRWGLERGARVINASSAATYGDGSLGFHDDPAMTPRLRPLNMYGYSKQLVDLWLQREKLEGAVASLKFFNVYGPNEYHKGDMRSVAVKAFHEISATGRLRLFRSCEPGMADGEQRRDFVHVGDCAEVMAWLLETPGANGILNVGTGRARSFNELARAVFSAMGRNCEIDYVAMPAHLAGKYQSFTEADMGRMRALGCPVRFRGIAEGVADYVRNHLMRPDPWL